ncbi:MAG: hypothetical protein WDO24_14560 [Pseudomonadota bacterium]
MIELVPSELIEVSLGHAGDQRELPLERRRHACRHGLGAGARQRRGNLDGGGNRLAAAARSGATEKLTTPVSSNPTAISVVPIGRRMNGSEMLIF